ncbi:MAG: hypothetical protein ABSD47_04210 [Candidatus Methylomirabilota bacterium]
MAVARLAVGTRLLQQSGVLQFAADAQDVFPEAGASVEVGGKLDDLGPALLGRIRVIAGHVSKAFGPQLGVVAAFAGQALEPDKAKENRESIVAGNSLLNAWAEKDREVLKNFFERLQDGAFAGVEGNHVGAG